MALLLGTAAVVGLKDNYLRTVLSYATANSHHEVVDLLLTQKADVDSGDLGGRTPLLWALDYGHATVVALLLEGKVDVDSRDQRGRTPLWYAACNGHDPVVKLLLGRYPKMILMVRNMREARHRWLGLYVLKGGIRWGVTPLLESETSVNSRS